MHICTSIIRLPIIKMHKGKYAKHEMLCQTSVAVVAATAAAAASTNSSSHIPIFYEAGVTGALFERKTVLNKPCRKRTCDFLITRRSNASLDDFLSTVFLNE